MRVSVLRSSSAISSRLRFPVPKRACHLTRAKEGFIELHDGRVVEKRALEEGTEEATKSWDLSISGDSVCESSVGLSVVLVHPQIPQNTGCTARTCAAANVPLHLIGPLGFDTDSRKLKRGGLDFWPYVVVKIHTSWQAFVEYYHSLKGPKRMIGFTKYSKRDYWEPGFRYQPGDWLIYGSETTGLPPEAHEEIARQGALLKIPMEETHVRCLNLSVSVGVGLYEAKRQLERHSTDQRPSLSTETLSC